MILTAHTRRANAATPAAPDALAHDLDILNTALSMEFLANAFYNEAEAFDFGATPTGVPVNQIFKLIQLHHATHVGTIIEDVSQRGGTPVTRATYAFPVTDIPTFVKHAVTISELLVSTYYGGMSSIQSPRILVGASQFAAVNARIASFIGGVAGMPPSPEPRTSWMTLDEVRSRAAAYIR